MSTTQVITPLRVTAPLDLLGDDAASLDFLAGEFLHARLDGVDTLEIIAPAELLPTLALAAAAFDATDMPERFRLVEAAHD